ncbi:diphthamide biosynthesis protein 3 isoform X1 [Hydra vulgaris]|nr:DPH3 homolog [Hydra vulgaris]
MNIISDSIYRSTNQISVISSYGMSVFHDEVEIEDFEYDEEKDIYYYPCPCGDRFEISSEMLADGEDVATCPSCSLIIKVIYDVDDFMKGEEVVTTSKRSLEKV